jgi:hypothetical protein
VYADCNRNEQSLATYLKALELAGTELHADHPLAFELNQSYIALQQRCANSAVSSPLKEGEAEHVIARSQKRRNSIWQDKPVAATESARTESARSEPGGMKESRLRSAGFDHQAFGRALHAPKTLLIVSALFVWLAVKFAMLPLQIGSAPEQSLPADFTGMQFQSCDQERTFKFSAQNRCVIDTNGNARQADYTALSPDKLDLLALFRGYLRRKERWYQFDGARLVGDDQVRLYGPAAPELAVIKKMWWYADFGQRCYKESRLYPADAEKFRQSEPAFSYINPCTKQSDYAAIVLQKQINAQADYTSPRHWRPGAIFCVNQSYKRFLIQGFDRDGNLLSGSDPRSSFAILCQNGVYLTKRQPVSQEPTKGPAPTTSDVQMFICSSKDLAATVCAARNLSQFLGWTVLIAAGLWFHAGRRFQYSRKVRLGSIVALAASTLFLIALYALALQT